MTMELCLYRHPQHERCEWATLRELNDFGVRTVDLARPPLRFWRSDEQAPSTILSNWGVRQLERLPMPSALLAGLPDDDNWQAMTRRSINRLLAWFLIAEDPQRRLDRSQVASLAHQASLVRHVLSDPNLQSVLIADEVGLGKTIEAGLILRELLAQNRMLRVLYLAPARLVRNVEREFKLLDLGFRIWIAGPESDARLTDTRVIASIHRAVAPSHFDRFSQTRWDVIVVDECHHLSNYSSEGHSPLRKYKLVDELRGRMGPDGRVILLSGTPHQGHAHRFSNLLRLLRRSGEKEAAPGRVIYRTKEDIVDWDNRPIFPKREVRVPVVVDLGPEHRRWLESIHRYFEPDHEIPQTEAGRRAATWRCAQALQWATSSVQAGLGYLIRQGIRAGFDLELKGMRDALASLRPYRGGSANEAVAELWERMRKQVGFQIQTDELADLEDLGEDDGEELDMSQLSALLEHGVALLKADPDAKWRVLYDKVLADVGDEKVVLFAQPIETVTALTTYLASRSGKRPALIVGDQSDAERDHEVQEFWRDGGPQFLVSSRAGGEGINLQIARRLVHVDVPWNPMELEQRIGRVHRFKSRRTILIDTIVTKRSREIDVYRVAESKLQLIAQNMASPERSNAVFARVMALVPPDELLQVIGRQPFAPLDESDRHEVERLVTAGFDRWSSFDGAYRREQQKIEALDAGQATWDDVRRLACDHLNATPVDEYTALALVYQGDEVVDASQRASVLRIGKDDFAVGDYGGMPISNSRGAEAMMLGINTDPVSAQLKKFAFGDNRAGAAYVRWEKSAPIPHGAGRSTGLLFFARQTLRLSGTSPDEIGVSLHAYVVVGDDAEELDPPARATVVRALLDATVRQKPVDDATGLIAKLQTLESKLALELARPSQIDVESQVRHAVFPLLAVIAG